MTDKVNKVYRLNLYGRLLAFVMTGRQLWAMKAGLLTIVTITILMGCGGSLSDEQRKKLHEGMDDQKILKVSDSEIVTASLDRGRTIYTAMERSNFESRKLDSLEKLYHINISLVTPGAGRALEVEDQLIEAYVAGAETGSVQDNIQKLHRTNAPDVYDSLLYTRPKLSPLPDGAVKVDGIWNIYLAKKDVIRSLDK